MIFIIIGIVIALGIGNGLNRIDKYNEASNIKEIKKELKKMNKVKK